MASGMCQKSMQEHDIYIAKSCVHKAAGSQISKMIFANFSWTYVVYY